MSSKTYQSWKHCLSSDPEFFRLSLFPVDETLRSYSEAYLRGKGETLVFRRQSTPYSQIPCEYKIGKKPRIVSMKQWTPKQLLNYCQQYQKIMVESRFKSLKYPSIQEIPTHAIAIYTTIERFKRIDLIEFEYHIERLDDQKSLFYLEQAEMNLLKWYLLCDSITDPSFQRKQIPPLTPYFSTWIHQEDQRYLFMVMKTILKWICVTRERGKGIAPIESESFLLYPYLEQFLMVFDLKNEPMKSYQDVRNGYIPHPKKNLLTALRAFIQQGRTHYMSVRVLKEIVVFFETNPPLKTVFNQVYELVNLILTPTLMDETNLEIPMGPRSIPWHSYLYGFALHPKIPFKLQRNMCLDLHLKDIHRIPSKNRKIYHQYVHKSTMEQFLYRLEYLSTLPKEDRTQMKAFKESKYKSILEENWWIVRNSEIESKELSEVDLNMIFIESSKFISKK